MEGDAPTHSPPLDAYSVFFCLFDFDATYISCLVAPNPNNGTTSLTATLFVAIVETLRDVLLMLESFVRQYNISTKFIWMMQGYYRVPCTVQIASYVLLHCTSCHYISVFYWHIYRTCARTRSLRLNASIGGLKGAQWVSYLPQTSDKVYVFSKNVFKTKWPIPRVVITRKGVQLQERNRVQTES